MTDHSGFLIRHFKPTYTALYYCCVIITLSLPNLSFATGSYSGGTGQPATPFQITEPNDLIEMSQHSEDWNLHFILTADINLNLAEPNTFTTALIAPDTDRNEYGHQGTPFTGSFDGQSHIIHNLTIYIAGGYHNYLGLFGQLESGAVVQNLGIEDASITGGNESEYLGCLVGSNGDWDSSGGIISNCYATGFVKGGEYSYRIGGLVGSNGDWQSSSGTINNCYTICSVTSGDKSGSLGVLAGSNHSTISNCYATGSVTGVASSGSIGGLVGYNSKGNISNCYATGLVTGGDDSRNLGGLVGQNYYFGTISNCYSTGSVTGYCDIGALAGRNDVGYIINCYATGSVIGIDNSHRIGGLVGLNVSSIISNCYATGYVTGSTGSFNIGGFCGYQSGNSAGISNCFWDTESSGMSVGYNLAPSEPGTITNVFGKTTALMQIQSTFTDYGWDFVDETSNGTCQIWQVPVSGGYPVLSKFNGYIPLSLAGNGTASNPYLISDPNELGAIYHYDSNAHYRLESDIDLSEISWTIAPVPVFNGVFDGNGQAITSLSITGGGYLGLFGFINNGKINNLAIDNVDISICSGTRFLGGLAGFIDNCIISNCSATGSVTGGTDSSLLGGLVGYNYKGNIGNCYAAVSITAETGSYYLGGLVGVNDHGTIRNCSAISSVSGGTDSSLLGGLVGENYFSTINNSYAAGSVTGGTVSYNLGGLVGYSSDSGITNCYATGSVTGGNISYRLGGLVGRNLYGTISNCYSAGSISGGTGSTNLGGLVGDRTGGTFSNCYFLDTAGPDNGYGEPLDDPNMQIQSNFVGWDFVDETANGSDDLWRMGFMSPGYPILYYQHDIPGDFTASYGVDLADYAFLANFWADTNCTPTNNNCSDTDLNQSGDIALPDLMLMLNHWLDGK